MTVHIGEAIAALGIQGFYLEENPTNEEEFNKWFKRAVGVDSVSESAIMSSDPSTFGVTWDQIKVKHEELLSSIEPARLVREKRNKLLAESDWTQTRDNVRLNDGTLQLYRQELRDITKSASFNPKLNADGTLDDSSVTWPLKPST